ncbi:MAG: hypothetical protein PVH84_07380 [Candidatus Aminicenantes bacterium]|jgi:hypothetical protein
MKKTIPILLPWILIFVMACKKGPESTANVEVIDGVTHIHNTDTPLFSERNVVFEENPESPFAKMAREIEIPSVKTVTERMLVDEEGRLWIETNEEKERDNRTFFAYDIFDSEGYYEARIWSDIRPGLFANGKMYHMNTDEDSGYRSLKRYRIMWKEKSDM